MILALNENREEKVWKTLQKTGEIILNFVS